MGEIITQKVLQARLEATWALALSSLPHQWCISRMQSFEADRFPTGKTVIQSTKAGLLGTREDSLSFFEKSVRVMAEIALHKGFEEYIKQFRTIKHTKVIPAWAIEHDSTVRGHYLEELQDHVFSAIARHMGAGYVFINSGYLEWLGGASAFHLHFGNRHYALVDSPYINGVIADPYPLLCRLKLTTPEITLFQKGIRLDYHIHFHHESLSNVLIMRDEIQHNWRYSNV